MDHSQKIISFPEQQQEIHRAKRMRTRRLKASDLHLGTIRIHFWHAELSHVEATVEDLSLHGLAVVVGGGTERSRLVLSGDRLEEVRISSSDGVLYQGTAVVRRVAERAPDLVLGLELDARGLDLARLYRSGARVGFAHRWDTARRNADFSHISPAFKAWVADLRAELDGVARFLAHEERALAAEDLATREQARLEFLNVIVPDLIDRITAARETLGGLVAELSEQQHAEYRAYCSASLGGFLLQAPFVRRALEKPLGYAGDYEMMNMLYRDPAEGETLLGQALNHCFTREPAAEANKNRITFLGTLIRQVIAAHPELDRIRIASLGCGPAREVQMLLQDSPELGARLEIALIDQEERAIAHCERTLAPIVAQTRARIHFIRESLRQLLTRDSLADKLGRSELIYSAGLFDYLDDRMFARILGVLYDGLSADGRIAIGNVASHNPSRWVMEYFAEWFLIHRSKEDLERLASSLLPAPRRVAVEAEPSGVNLFLLVER